jgi:hypothetical protein
VAGRRRREKILREGNEKVGIFLRGCEVAAGGCCSESVSCSKLKIRISNSEILEAKKFLARRVSEFGIRNSDFQFPAGNELCCRLLRTSLPFRILLLIHRYSCNFMILAADWRAAAADFSLLQQTRVRRFGKSSRPNTFWLGTFWNSEFEFPAGHGAHLQASSKLGDLKERPGAPPHPFSPFCH